LVSPTGKIVKGPGDQFGGRDVGLPGSKAATVPHRRGIPFLTVLPEFIMRVANLTTDVVNEALVRQLAEEARILLYPLEPRNPQPYGLLEAMV
jgi:hypothetical protein